MLVLLSSVYWNSFRYFSLENIPVGLVSLWVFHVVCTSLTGHGDVGLFYWLCVYCKILGCLFGVETCFCFIAQAWLISNQVWVGWSILQTLTKQCDSSLVVIKRASWGTWATPGAVRMAWVDWDHAYSPGKTSVLAVWPVQDPLRVRDGASR